MLLARPRDFVLLDIDNSVAFSYLSKSGGKVARLNALLRPFLQWLRTPIVSVRGGEYEGGETCMHGLWDLCVTPAYVFRR